jgi:hypothetical protein
MLNYPRGNERDNASSSLINFTAKHLYLGPGNYEPSVLIGPGNGPETGAIDWGKQSGYLIPYQGVLAIHPPLPGPILRRTFRRTVKPQPVTSRSWSILRIPIGRPRLLGRLILFGGSSDLSMGDSWTVTGVLIKA